MIDTWESFIIAWLLDELYAIRAANSRNCHPQLNQPLAERKRELDKQNDP